MSTLTTAQIEAIVDGRCRDPFTILGRHEVSGEATSAAAGRGASAATPDPVRHVARAFLPWAEAAELLSADASAPARRLHPAGLFEAELPPGPATAYRWKTSGPHGSREHEDPYRFTPVGEESDLHTTARGDDLRAWTRMGAHPMVHEAAAGVCFRVWAPNAHNVNLMGSFNGWDGRCHPMRGRGDTGIWELFVPGIERGALYKFEVQTTVPGAVADKADPFGFAMELRPNTASVVWGLTGHEWNDDEWMRTRAARQSGDRPVSIYEVHLGSWRRDRVPGEHRKEAASSDEEQPPGWLDYDRLADELVPYVRDLGYTHLELLPVTEHPYDGSWGYQTVGYFAPSSRFGSPDGFRRFVEAAHRAGLGIILDWVPGHFPRDGHGLVFFDGTHLYEHADPRQGYHPDWGTVIYNYSRPQVMAFLLSSALFWLEEYHIDGLRVDAVASMLYLDYSRREGEWIPNRHGGRENLEAVEFLERLNEEVHARHPGVLTFAEESTAWPGVSKPVADGGLGFDVKWNMGWMHDMLAYMHTDPLFRPGVHDKLTFSIYYAFSERFLLPLSHDEVVHGKYSLADKMPGDADQKFSNLRLLYGYMYAHPGKKLLFMGGEFGQWREWNFDDQLDWHLCDGDETGPTRHARLRELVRELNGLYREQRALHELDFHWKGFEWIDFDDVRQSVVSFVRWSKGRDECVVVVANFTPVTRDDYRVGVPLPGTYEVLLNTDDVRFGGQGGGTKEPVASEKEAWQEREDIVRLQLPPLGMLFLRPRSGVPTRKER